MTVPRPLRTMLLATLAMLMTAAIVAGLLLTVAEDDRVPDLTAEQRREYRVYELGVKR